MDRLVKETGAKRASVEGVFYRELPKSLAKQGLNPDEYRTPKTKRFSEAKFAKVRAEPKDVMEEDQVPAADQKDGGGGGGTIKAKNPALRGGADPIPDSTMLPTIKTLDYTFKGLFANYELLSESERLDAASNLNMAFGPLIAEHERAKMVLGILGLVAVFGGRVKDARAKSKSQKERAAKIKKAETAALAGTVESPDVRAEFDRQMDRYAKAAAAAQAGAGPPGGGGGGGPLTPKVDEIGPEV